ncbi:putative antitoxin of wHTH fold [Halalkaliarchaeum sp. AArc-CO]|nr:putative antitoxin of wHTH fold [Halalkaliarchaeum sp. AArc-CO]
MVGGEDDVSMAELFTAHSFDDDYREAFADREREFATARQNGDRRTRASRTRPSCTRPSCT